MKVKTHESYGMLQLNRCSCSGEGMPFFGSDIKHNDYIALRISTAEANRHLNEDWYHANNKLIEVNMSYSQFTEAICSMNTMGVPVTLQSIRKEGGGLKRLSEPPFESKREMFDEEVERDLSAIKDKLVSLEDCVKEMIGKKTVNKAERKEMLKAIQSVKQDIFENLPFVKDQFKRSMDITVTDAKCEVEAFVLHKRLNADGTLPLVEMTDGEYHKQIQDILEEED